MTLAFSHSGCPKLSGQRYVFVKDLWRRYKLLNSDVLAIAIPPDRTLPHQVAIALGSNLGDSPSILAAALDTLNQRPDIRVVTVSHLYQTVAVGPPQPDYLNCCALLQTNLPPRALLQTLLQTETAFGRVRQERWGPRLLDLDLLLFDDLVMAEPQLHIPHPHMTERAFVLVPLAEIAPDWQHPILAKAIAHLLQAVDCSGVVKVNPGHSAS